MILGAEASMGTEPDVNVVFNKVAVGKVPFESCDLRSAVQWTVREAVSSTRKATPIRLANAYCVALAAKDITYEELLLDGGKNFPDGTPVVWGMRALLGMGKADTGQRPGRVRGPSFFEDVLSVGREHEVQHFLVGGSTESIVELADLLKRKHPGLRISGYFSPPYAPLSAGTMDSISAAIARAPISPHIVWVGLGTPKQDFVAAEICKRHNVLAIGVGAAFDFSAGTVKPAPVLIQNSGFEWLYRLLCEPKRLWKRYLFGNSRFILVLARSLLNARISVGARK